MLELTFIRLLTVSDVLFTTEMSKSSISAIFIKVTATYVTSWLDNELESWVSDDKLADIL